ncbi:MAG: RNA polymerase sigma factor [Clostridia bacterium]|nr:RNA polymerase sigma factor [Clostridia bacterium]
MTEEKILEMLFSRSENSISAIDEKYGRKCRQLAQGILGNEQDAEECVNDAYLSVWNAIPPETPCSLEAYLYGILRKLALKKYRSNTAQKRCSYYADALDEMEASLAAEETVESALEKKYFGEVMEEFLRTLNEENRAVFLRRYWFLESIREIADALGTSEKNVTVRLTRTREKLRKFLKEKGVYL